MELNFQSKIYSQNAVNTQTTSKHTIYPAPNTVAPDPNPVTNQHYLIFKKNQIYLMYCDRQYKFKIKY